MKTIRIAALLMLFTACESYTDNCEGLSGAWYYVDLRDTTYNEIYFTKELLIHNLSSMGVSRVYEYELSNDSILIGQNKEFFMVVADKSQDKFTARDSGGHLLVFEGLDLSGDVSYKKFTLPEARIIALQKGRVMRGNKILLKRGLLQPYDSLSDSLLLIPEPEK